MQYDAIDNYCNIHDNEDDLIFDVTPFIAHLVDNVECSFSAEGGCVTIAELSLGDMHELLHRLSQCALVPSSVDYVRSAGGRPYRLGLSRDSMGHGGYYGDSGDSGDSEDGEEDSLCSLRLLKQMIKVFCNSHSNSGDTGSSLSLRLHPTELHITNVTLDSMDTVARTLKSICVKPKRVFSDSNSLYSFELLRDDISVHLQQSGLAELSEGADGADEEDIFAGILNCNDYFTCLRSLRHNLAASQLSRQQNNNNDNDNENNQNGNIQSSFTSSGGSGRGRGRPRKLINNNSPAVEGEPKRKRGRPRLSDLHSLITSIKSEVTRESSVHSEKSAEQDSPVV